MFNKKIIKLASKVLLVNSLVFTSSLSFGMHSTNNGITNIKESNKLGSGAKIILKHVSGVAIVYVGMDKMQHNNVIAKLQRHLPNLSKVYIYCPMGAPSKSFLKKLNTNNFPSLAEVCVNTSGTTKYEKSSCVANIRSINRKRVATLQSPMIQI